MADRICTVDACARKELARGLCGLHYQRMHARGTTEKFSPAIPIENRFWDKVDKSGDCWVWTAYRNAGGYGRVGIRGSTTDGAHRQAWILTYGPIPDGMCVLHRCDNPPCVRPDHLFLGDNAANAADMTAKGRHACFVGSKHPQAILTEADVVRIRSLITAGGKQRDIAKEFGVNHRTISMINTHQIWRHVP